MLAEGGAIFVGRIIEIHFDRARRGRRLGESLNRCWLQNGKKKAKVKSYCRNAPSQ